MNKKQFLRWKSFSMRMAEKCYPEATKERTEKMVTEINSFFMEMESNYKDFWDWDGNDGSEALGDYVDDYFDEYQHWNAREECYTGKFYNQVTSCIRAGFDVAVRPSGGVVGFRVCDLYRMWNDKVPSWVKAFFEGDFDTFDKSESVWL
jgi:hypothetical protein